MCQNYIKINETSFWSLQTDLSQLNVLNCFKSFMINVLFSTLTIIYCRHSWNITFPFWTANFLRQLKTNVLETTLWIIKTKISNLVSRARYWNYLQIRSEWKDSFIVKIRLPYKYHGLCLIRDMNWLSFARSWVQPRMLVMFMLLIVLGFFAVFFALLVFVLFLVYPTLPVFLDCPLLIAPSIFSKAFSITTMVI